MAAAMSVAAARIAATSGPPANSEAALVRKRPLSMASCERSTFTLNFKELLLSVELPF